MSRTQQDIPANLNYTQLPKYPIPEELAAVLNFNRKSELSRKSQMYSKKLESMKKVVYVNLVEHNYIEDLHFALYLEEHKGIEEMKNRTMFDQIVEKLSSSENPYEHLFAIQVEELDEERPWIREGDFVDVTDTETDETYALRISKVQKNDVVAIDDAEQFFRNFQSNNLYNIGFRFQNYPLRCAHYALEIADNEDVVTYFFPLKVKSFIKMGHKTYRELEILNPNIETNPEQKQAVLNIVNKSSFPAPYVLFGPPGTGKTATLIEAICQIKKASPKNRMLVCTPSNTAADEIAKRLLKFLDASDVYRIYSQAKIKSAVDKELESCYWCGDGCKAPLRRKDINAKAVLISTLCTATKFLQLRLRPDYFSHIIIDEAGQATEPNMLIPIAIASRNGQLHSQVVLAGDPKQLGPTIMSEDANKILGRSILERLMSYDCFNNYNPRYITKLLQNYRSDPRIIEISNKLFYDGELVAKYSDTPRTIRISNKLLYGDELAEEDSDDDKIDFPVIFVGMKGNERKAAYSPSKCNNEEIRMVLKLVNSLMNDNVPGKDIGIITFFKLQSDRIKNKLRNVDDKEKHASELKDIAVGTVELFQGQERKIMIMTAVRNKIFSHDGKKHIGFLSNPKRFNVAMTRAQNNLIVVGNPRFLHIDNKWHYLLEYCIENGSYRGLEFSPQASNGTQPILHDSQNIADSESSFGKEPLKLFSSLFSLGDRDLSEDISQTIDVIVEPDRAELKEPSQEQNRKSFARLDFIYLVVLVLFLQGINSFMNRAEVY